MVVYFTNKKSGDSIPLPRAVKRTSIAFMLPSYNTGTTIRCNYSINVLMAGENSSLLTAFDLSTNEVSQYNTLSGACLVVPVS